MNSQITVTLHEVPTALSESDHVFRIILPISVRADECEVRHGSLHGRDMDSYIILSGSIRAVRRSPRRRLTLVLEGVSSGPWLIGCIGKLVVHDETWSVVFLEDKNLRELSLNSACQSNYKGRRVGFQAYTAMRVIEYTSRDLQRRNICGVCR